MARTYFYVDDHGTRTSGGGDGSLRSGAFSAMAPADVYGSLDDVHAEAAPPVEDDVIIVNASMQYANGSSSTLAFNDGVAIVTASSSDCQVYALPAATMVTTPHAVAYQFYGNTTASQPFVVDGMWWESGESGTVAGSGRGTIMHDAVFDGSNQGGSQKSIGLSSKRFLFGCNTKLLWGSNGGNGYIAAGENSSLVMFGGEIDGNAYSVAPIVGMAPISRIECHGTEIRNANAVIASFGGPNNTSYKSVLFSNCKLPNAWTIAGVTDNSTNTAVIMQCDSAYQYVQQSRQGDIEFVTSIYYDAHDTLDDGITKGSFEFDTSANAKDVDALLMGNRQTKRVLSAINTEAASKKKVRIRFVPLSGDSLNTADVMFYVASPISGSEHQIEWTCHALKPMESGSALSTETTSGNWTGAGLATDAYYFDIDMGSPGNGRVMVIPGVCKANVTVYFSWQLEFVA